MALAPEGRKKPGFFELSLLANHFPELHGARVLAIVLVVQLHLTFALVEGGLPIDPRFGKLSATVFFGMDLFFVLSGFLIGTMLLHAQGSGSVLRFYARRSFRIFPLYYVALAALLALYPLTAAQKQNLPYELLYLTNYRVVLRETVVMMWGWSLCVEEHFYLAVPLLMAALHALRSHRARISLLLLLWASALLVRVLILRSHDGAWDAGAFLQAIYIKTHTRYDTLVAGILLAYLQHHFRERIAELVGRRGVRLAIWTLTVICLLLLLSPQLFPSYFTYAVIAWGTLSTLLYVPSLLLLLNAQSGLSRFLSARRFLRVATLGYGIYLWHVPVCEKLVVPLARGAHVGMGLSMLIVWPLSLAALLCLSASVAYLTHVLVEKPALRLRDRVAA